MAKLAVLMTCHNRREKTLNAISALSRQHGLPPGLDIAVHLVDAGSRDGTVDAVAAKFPDVDVVRVGDDVFWGGGMRIASRRSGRFTHQLWLNDDVILDDEALAMLLGTSRGLADRALVVGAMRSGDGTATTYSGLRRNRAPRTPRRMWSPLVEPDGTVQPLDVCHGNAVLVPEEVHRRIGNIDRQFPHTMGDFDYGLRARRAGIGVYLAPRHAGVCDRNPPDTGSREPGIGVREALRRQTSVRELPVRPWSTYCLRHLWPWAPLMLLSPYIKTAVRATCARYQS
ncbi:MULTISPECIES: glycosyltransferase family 2 protein [Streptomyces]|uniref:Glycosyltransferase n=1 Tax=Streptomyces mirabilis TaxID=68239 RepID=A0ABU3UTK7_9ACTN|nr:MULTISPECIES: glycosyltransferase [Streptomyces]MDU8997261.1 glycosyltransferase [Streptomyces mirabilis]QDN87844.1 glycosyltransferase family 2 protein [Streptomyces sp. RLB3-6]QDO08678.1 glycosyltransferase family 2 protein [Streptomyces sp. S1D4-23]